MRHRKFKYRLNRFTSWRKATLISLVRNLLIHQSITTTEQRAKAARSLVEGLITLAKVDNVSNRRRAFKLLGEHKMVGLLFEDIAKLFNEGSGGFTRIIRLKKRRGDDASLVIWELTEIKKKEKKGPKKEKEAKEKPTQEEKPVEEKKPKAGLTVKEKLALEKKPAKSFFGGLRKIFKKERDSL